MEGRVKELLSTGDYYSAHQLLLSLAQRHERAGKVDQAASILTAGLYAMKEQGGKVPLPTLTDCYRKWSELPKGKVTSKAIADLWPHLLEQRGEQGEKHPVAAEDWFVIGSNLTFGHGEFESLLPALALLKLADRLEFLDECCPAEKYTAYSDITGFEVEAVCWSVLRNLASRNLVVPNMLIAQLAQGGTALDDPTGSLPSWFSLHPDACSLVNFCQLLFALCQREGKCPVSMFDALEQHYRKALARLGKDTARLMATIRARYFARAQVPPNNPLAAMMQMMNGMGMPGAGRPAKGGRRNNFDLD